MRNIAVLIGVVGLLVGCGGKTLMCGNGTITLETKDDTYHGEGVVLTNGMTVERCLQIRQELGQIP